MSIKSSFQGGGVFWLGGGGSADFIFMGAGIFLNCSCDAIVRGGKLLHSFYCFECNSGLQ